MSITCAVMPATLLTLTYESTNRIVRHGDRWSRAHRPTFQELPGAAASAAKMKKDAQARVRDMLSMGKSKQAAANDSDLSEASLSSCTRTVVRTVEEYEDMSGVHFQTQTLEHRALCGGLDAPADDVGLAPEDNEVSSKSKSGFSSSNSSSSAEQVLQLLGFLQ